MTGWSKSQFFGAIKGTLLIAVCAIDTIIPAFPQKAPVKNIILVHGAWADGSGGRGVHDILLNAHFNVSIVQDPETFFKDDVAATKRMLALQDGPCVLVGNLYGGAVITEAGNDPSVAGLVYIAAHMPDVGEKESDDGKRFPSDLVKSSGRHQTASPSSIQPSSMRYSLPTYLLSKLQSWHARRFSILPKTSRPLSPPQPGESSLRGFWWRGVIARSIRSWSAGMLVVPRAIRLKCPVPAMRSSSPIRRKSPTS